MRNDTEEYKHNTTRFARKDATCYIFGEKMHKEPYCPKRQATPKYQWHANRAMQNMQVAGYDTVIDIVNTYDMSTIESSS